MLKVHCNKSVRGYFTKGMTYEAHWRNEVPLDNENCFEKLSLVAKDNRNLPHIIAEYTIHDKWFKEHFEVSENIEEIE